jgi:hypothetical protein
VRLIDIVVSELLGIVVSELLGEAFGALLHRVNVLRRCGGPLGVHAIGEVLDLDAEIVLDPRASLFGSVLELSHRVVDDPPLEQHDYADEQQGGPDVGEYPGQLVHATGRLG